MKVSGGLTEEGVVVGNTYDKYGSRNPIVRRLMAGFDDALSSLVARAAPQTVHEIGCGEGFWVMKWRRDGIEARGTDFSSRVIDLARANARERSLPEDLFETRSIYELEPPRDSADLLVCCEVLEHLEDPRKALEALKRTARGEIIISVPREPLWRALNMARGKYLSDLGNTPGHLQHWSRARLIALVEPYFEILEVRTPTPWTMLLGRVRSS